MEVDEDVIAADVLLFGVEAALESQSPAVLHIEVRPADGAVLESEGLGSEVGGLVGVPGGPDDYIRDFLHVGA